MLSTGLRGLRKYTVCLFNRCASVIRARIFSFASSLLTVNLGKGDAFIKPSPFYPQDTDRDTGGSQ